MLADIFIHYANIVWYIPIKVYLSVPPQGDKYSPFLYDAVMIYVVSLNETLNKGLDPSNGMNVMRNMRQKVFEGECPSRNSVRFELILPYFTGMTGSLVLDAYGDREPDYWVTDMNPYTGAFVKIAEVLNKNLGTRVRKLLGISS